MNKLTAQRLQELGLDEVLMEDVKAEINQEMKMNKTSYRVELKLPKASNFKLDDQGALNVTIVFVQLHTSQVIKLRLAKVDAYLEKLESHAHLAHTLQNRDDVLR